MNKRKAQDYQLISNFAFDEYVDNDYLHVTVVLSQLLKSNFTIMLVYDKLSNILCHCLYFLLQSED